jgi:transcriptional regulator with XRE-family HTH domain
MKKLAVYLRKVTTPAMTAAEIAKRLDVSQSTVSLWMSGKRRPGLNKLKQLSALTGIKVEDLL